MDHGIGTSDNKDITLLHLEMFVVQVLEGVKLERTERNMLSDIYKGNCNRDQEEPIAWETCKLQQSSSQIVHFIE